VRRALIWLLGCLACVLLCATGPGQPSGQAVVKWEPTGIREVDIAVRRNWRSTLCPAHFKNNDGSVRIDDLTLACLVLHELGEKPLLAIGDVYVIKGVTRFKGNLLARLAARAGWDLEMVEETAEQATWRIRYLADCGPAPCLSDVCPHWKPARTITYRQAKKAGWGEASGMYEKMPDRMLGWRCITYLVDHYAPGVRFGIDDRVASHGATIDWGAGTEPPSVGEVATAPAPHKLPGPDETPPRPSAAVSSQGPDPTPVEVIDRAPEARGMEPPDE
jgi:hypothetical protein